MRSRSILERDLGQSSDRNPGLFFTAAINGCSVFARGDARAPQVCHGGIDGSVKVNSTDFWRQCLASVLEGQGGAATPIRCGRLWSCYLQENWPKTKGTGLQVEQRKQKNSFLGIPYTETLYAARRVTTRAIRVRSSIPTAEPSSR